MFVNKQHMARKVLYHLAPGCFSKMISYYSSPWQFRSLYWLSCCFLNKPNMFHFRPQGLAVLSAWYAFSWDIGIVRLCLHLCLCSNVYPLKEIFHTSSCFPQLSLSTLLYFPSYHLSLPDITSCIYHLFPVPCWIIKHQICTKKMNDWVNGWMRGIIQPAHTSQLYDYFLRSYCILD